MSREVEIFGDWGAIEGAAGDALGRAAQPCLFDRLAWYRLIAAHAPPAGALVAARGPEGSWLFLAVEGGKAAALANWYSLRFAAAGGKRGTDLVAIACALKQRALGLDSVVLGPLAEDDPLPAAFEDAGWTTFVGQATTSWTIDTRGMDFDAYWATRGSRLRNTAKRKAKAAGLEIAIHCCFDSEAWAAYEEVYRQSWKPAEGSTAFLRALGEQEGAAGTLRLGIARKEGRPVAAQLWLTEGGRATIHKLAYVEDMRELSPGTVLSVAMFQHALDVDKADCIDFGTGDDGYKADWMGEARPLNRLIAYNPQRVAGLAGAARQFASTLVRRLRNH